MYIDKNTLNERFSKFKTYTDKNLVLTTSLDFPTGEDRLDIEVPILNDEEAEGDEVSVSTML